MVPVLDVLSVLVVLVLSGLALPVLELVVLVLLLELVVSGLLPYLVYFVCGSRYFLCSIPLRVFRGSRICQPALFFFQILVLLVVLRLVLCFRFLELF